MEEMHLLPVATLQSLRILSTDGSEGTKEVLLRLLRQNQLVQKHFVSPRSLLKLLKESLI